MPKEIAHISLAQKVFRHLPENSLFLGSIKKHFNLFLYGSIAPDTCYYYLLGPHSSFIQNQSKKFHTTDTSSLLPVLNFLKHFPDNDPKAMAFAAGICCHIMTDTLFHPMIYYFSGMEDQHTDATTRHRLIETALDIHFWSLSKIDTSIFIDYIFNNLEIRGTELIHFFEYLFSLEKNKWERSLKYALKYHIFSYQLFKNHTLYRIIQFFHGYKFGIPSKYESLFYPSSNPVELSFFSGRIHYRNPIKGTPITTNIEALIQKTIKQVLILISILETALIYRQELSDVIHHPNLPKISPCLSKETFMFWNGQADIRRIIYKRL
ncbi:MAG: zinc dependent phospholipase C family protein [Pseudomonadota bacterium]